MCSTIDPKKYQNNNNFGPPKWVLSSGSRTYFFRSFGESSPVRRKRIPREAQETPRWTKMAHKIAPRGPKMGQNGSKMVQASPKRPQKNPRKCPRDPKIGQDGSEMAQDSPKMPQKSPKKGRARVGSMAASINSDSLLNMFWTENGTEMCTIAAGELDHISFVRHP